MQPQYQYRYFGTFRFLLALMVALSHFQVVHAPTDAQAYLAPLGEIAVFLFFVLSGFIITEALFVFYNGRPIAFITNRFLRIFPPFFLALLISVSVHMFTRFSNLPLLGLDHDYAYVLNLRNYAWNIFSLLDWRVPQGKQNFYIFVRYIWAVVIEWQFYLLAMLLFFLVSKYRPHIRITIAILIFASAYLLVTRIADFPLGTVPFFGQWFLLGIAFYGISVGQELGWLKGKLPYLTLAIAIFVVYDHLKYWKHEFTIGIAFSFGIALIFILSFSNDAWFSSSRYRNIDTRLGNLSYPIYLNHFAVEVGLFSMTSERSWGMMLLAICLSVVVSVIAFLITEPFTLRIRNVIRGQALG